MADRVGQQFSTYQLKQLIGRGAASEVYLGEHIQLGTQVAVKFLHANPVRPRDIEQFRSRARQLIELIHPSIVQVLDCGLEEDIPYLVMDYVPNGTLRQRYPGGSRLELTTIVPFVQQIAAGLRYVHRENFVHQGLSPEHLLLGRHGEVLMSDFEYAVLIGSLHHMLEEGVGIANYMAPEVFRGKPVPASDQYSLGIMVYEWLTGSVPFQGTLRDVAHQHALMPPLPLRERMPGIPREIEEVVLTALAKDPGQRFADVQVFATRFTHASKEALDSFTLAFPTEMPSSAFLWQVSSPEVSTVMRAISAPLKALPAPDTPSSADLVRSGSGSLKIDQQQAADIFQEPVLQVAPLPAGLVVEEPPSLASPARPPSALINGNLMQGGRVSAKSGYLPAKKSYRKDVLRMAIALLVIALIGGMEALGILGKGPFSFMASHPAQAVPPNAISTIGATTTGTAAPAERFAAFPIPTGSAGSLDIIVGPDGNLWFTEQAANLIGRFPIGQ